MNVFRRTAIWLTASTLLLATAAPAMAAGKGQGQNAATQAKQEQTDRTTVETTESTTTTVSSDCVSTPDENQNDGSTTAPADGTTAPTGTTTAPTDSTTTAPTGSTTTAPTDSTTTAPTGSTTTAPADSTTTAPAGSTTTAPAGSTTTAPTDSTATAPTGTTTTDSCSKGTPAVNLTGRGKAAEHNPNVDANGQLQPGTATEKTATSPTDAAAQVQAQEQVKQHVDKVKQASRELAQEARKAGATGSYLVYVNGSRLNVTPLAHSGRTLVPFRNLAETLGAQVSWNPSTRTVTMVKGDTTVVISIGATTATVNGVEVPLDVPAEINEDHTFVPLRFISAALGADVDYDPATGAITVITSPAPTDTTTTPTGTTTTPTDTTTAPTGTTTAPTSTTTAPTSTTTAPTSTSTTTTNTTTTTTDTSSTTSGTTTGGTTTSGTGN